MTNAIISIAAFIVVIVVHELSHGLAAYWMGDNTAKDAGRLTLNPLAHADPVGSILLPFLLVISSSPVIFGWAKPVPINPLNFKSPRKGLFITSLAGPGSNFVLAAVFALIFKTGIFAPHSIMWKFLLSGVMVSLVLGVFNLVPIPPLDGSNIVLAVLPKKMMRYYAMLERYGFIILIAMLYLGLLNKVIFPFVSFFSKILLG